MEIPPKFALRILLGIILFIIVGRTISLIMAYQKEGQWNTFDSISWAKPPKDPDGFRLNYPTSWDEFSYSGGATKNGRELRASFESPYYWWTSKTYLNIWWRRIDGHWTLTDASNWFEHELGFGIRDHEIEMKHDAWQTTTIGKGKYPALVQTFGDPYGVFHLPPSKAEERVVLLIVGDEAFALTFNDDEVDPETVAIFQKMLDSFEVYK